MKRIVSYILYIVSFSAGILGSCVKDISNWWSIAKPFYTVFVITLLVALYLTYTNQVRRIFYPVFVCISAWAYKHKVLITKFTQSTYRVYQINHCSYGELYAYTQTLFDIYVEGLAEIE